MGQRIQDLESRAGRRLDDVAKALLRMRVVRGPARKLANSRFAWNVVSRIDRIRARRAIDRIRAASAPAPAGAAAPPDGTATVAMLPRHVAIIMDGNRRFASALGLRDVAMGHVAGQERLETVLDWCLELGIKVLTVYAFSTENFQRAEAERELLMELFEHNFRKMLTDPRVHDNRIRVRCIGDLGLLPLSVQEAAKAIMDRTAAYDGYTFNVAIAYGGRQEIVEAVRTICADVRDGKLTTDQVTADTISSRLYTADLPDPDFVIRTSGEERISNFLLWQVAYAELYFADVYWPELGKFEFLRAIEEFQHRKRRFGA